MIASLPMYDWPEVRSHQDRYWQALETLFAKAREGSLTLGLGAFGFKYNVATRLLLTGHVVVPLTEGGLRSRVTTTFGLDYAF